MHLHSRPERAAEKVLAAYEAGCRRFDGALTGLGGCPFAGDATCRQHSHGNRAHHACRARRATGIDTRSLAMACAMTGELREKYAHDATPRLPKAKLDPAMEYTIRMRLFTTPDTSIDKGEIATITLTVPEKRNAISAQMIADLLGAL